MEPSPPSAHLEQHMAPATRLILLIRTLWQLLMRYRVFHCSSFTPCQKWFSVLAASWKAFLKLFQWLLWLHFLADWWFPAAALAQRLRLSVPRSDSGSPARGLQVSSPARGTSRWNSRDVPQHWVRAGSHFSWDRHAPPWLFYVHLKVHPLPRSTNPPLISVSREDVLTENREWN